MEEHRSKMKEFVQKIWSNPVISAVPLHRKESQIISFIRENQKSLEQAFGQPQFFPGLAWEQVIRLLFAELTEQILESYRDVIDGILERAIHPGIRDFFAKEGKLEIDSIAFRDFILNNMRNKAMRDQYVLALAAIQAEFYTRYTPAFLDRRKVIYIDVVRRDRIDMDAMVMAEFLNLSSLFRPLYYYKFEDGDLRDQSLQSLERNVRRQESAMVALENLIGGMGSVPMAVMQPGLDSPKGVDDYPDVSGVAKLINIFVNRAAEYDPAQKTDRGAESPDKSWFSINRRTAKYNGYDGRFLEELYLIAGEEGW